MSIAQTPYTNYQACNYPNLYGHCESLHKPGYVRPLALLPQLHVHLIPLLPFFYQSIEKEIFVEKQIQQYFLFRKGGDFLSIA